MAFLLVSLPNFGTLIAALRKCSVKYYKNYWRASDF